MPSLPGKFPLRLLLIGDRRFEKRKRTLADSATLRVKLLAVIGLVFAKEQSTHRQGGDSAGRRVGRDKELGDEIQIRSLDIIGEREIQELGDVLLDCVAGGASVGFMLPMSRAKAEAFWRRTSASMARGERRMLVAEDAAGMIVGTVQVVLDQPENQPHRGDIAKMLVHRRVRGQGVGAALLAAAERMALEAGKTLLVLDTVTGSDAEGLYARHAWQRCGEIPNYALWPDGRPCTTTIFFKFMGE
jgi:GNAT superfamily N-acetyltransferase